MSLPDTVFIFVLALIIFGPKKLPEIGRQLGRLVGEFRRASNEFKFQIEEELRQAEISDRQKIASPQNELPSSGSNENPDPSSFDLSTSSDIPTSSDLSYGDETLPVGQYPNIDTLNPEELNELTQDAGTSESAAVAQVDEGPDAVPPESPIIRAAAGTQPRNSLPYSSMEPAESLPEEAASAARKINDEAPAAPPNAGTPSETVAAQASENEGADSYATRTVADISNG